MSMSAGSRRRPLDGGENLTNGRSGWEVGTALDGDFMGIFNGEK